MISLLKVIIIINNKNNTVLHSGLSGRSSGLTEGEVRRNVIELSLSPTCFRNFRAYKPSQTWFPIFVEPSSFSGLRQSTWIFFPLSAAIWFYSALQLCLFLQFIREPAGPISWPVESYLEHNHLFALISPPLGIKYRGLLRKKRKKNYYSNNNNNPDSYPPLAFVFRICFKPSVSLLPKAKLLKIRIIVIISDEINVTKYII